MFWTTRVRYIDRHTSEVLTTQHIKSGQYIKIISHVKKSTKSNVYGYVDILWECERNNQIKLDL